MNRRALLRRVTFTEARRAYLAAVDAARLPPEARRGVEQWIDKEILRLRSTTRDGDELYFYRYEKCCGWYREGYVVVRAGCIVGEINTREDM